IWSDKDLERFFDLTIEKGSESFSDIVSSLNIKTKNGVIEKWKPNIKAIKTLLNYWESELADGMPYSDYVIIALSNDNNYVFNPINDRYWIMHREKESMEIPTLT